MKDRWLFIVNPVAENGKSGKAWNSILKELNKNGIDPVVWQSEFDGHIEQLVAKGTAEGFRKIASYGGDGSLHDCVNGVMQQTSCASEELLLAHYPAGTGNDWCRMYKVPKKPKAWAQMLLQEQQFKHDVGLIDLIKDDKPAQRYFVNIAGLAYESICATWIDAARKTAKLLKGKLFYDFLVLKGLFGFEAPVLKFNYDGIERQEKLFNMVIAINRYNAGGMMPAPYADPSDGIFDVTTFADMPMWNVLRDFPKMRAGTILKNPKVTAFRTQKVVVNRIDKPDFVEADGEFVGYTPATFSIKKHALRFVIGEVPEVKVAPF